MPEKESFGGKGNNYKKVQDLLKDTKIFFPKTFFISTKVFRDYINSKKQFGPDSIKIFSGILEEIKNPLAVRSSSLLEDQKGFSFAGKYESVFVGNVGSSSERLEKLLSAVKKVYESTFNTNAIAYREKHGFLNDKEEMALLVQEVVGEKYKNYYLPAMAGVAFSQNGYCWNKEINKKDGLVRLVFGLGTRAVGRGYVRLFSPAKPSMRPEGTEVNNIQKCSQKKVDVIDLETGELKSVHFRELVGDGFSCFPNSQSFVSLRDGNYLYRPVSNLWDATHIPVLTMDGAITSPWMDMDIPKKLGTLLKDLESKLGYAVDIEFAISNGKLYLLQTRPLSEGKDKKPVPIPKLAEDKILFTAHRNLPTTYVPDIEYLVYVDENAYHKWPYQERQSVARVIGKINETLKGKRFALIGPGRWGSWNPELGVPVNYAEISNAVILIEVARRKATYTPEVSFGSHFFQDLIEDNIAYLPLYPDEPNEIFNDKILSSQSTFKNLLPDDYYRKFEELIKIIPVNATAILNGETEHAVVFLK